ncbi:MAG: cupin domain-containing protein [Campylobacteraceae bacterium]|jgi:cupin 2 domain-containing protein|nr:cupin domain-containing protein [Campylobacteraceae bacterium]
MSIFDKPAPKCGEIHDILCKLDNVEIAHIISSSMLPDMEYCQNMDEFVMILEGEALMKIENQEIRLKKGEYIFIKAFVKHRILNCKNGTHWLAVYIKSQSRYALYH